MIFYGYVVEAAAFSIMSLAWGANRSFGVFLEPLLCEFGWSRTSISGAFTLGMIILGITGPLAGRLTDRIGPKKVLIGCSLILASGYLLMSRMNSIWEFYLYCGVLVGIGMSGMLSPLMSLIARWFVKRRSLMAGILASGPALGIAILPFLASLFISTVGWRMTYIILGCLILFVIVPSALFLKRDPEEINLQPYGTIQHSGMSSMQYEGLSLKRALCTGQFWTLGLVAFCAFFTINVYTVHIVIHAIGLEISSNTAATLLSLAAGISVIGRILVGAVADAIGNRRTIMLCFLMGAIAFMLITSSNEIAILYLGASIFGGTGWATGSLIAPLTASLFGLKSHGTILACIMMSATIGGAVGPVLIGYVFDITGSYHCGFIITIFACILAFTSSFLLKPVAERKKL